MSVLALVNAIMMSGNGKAADASTGSSTSTPDSTATTAPAKKQTATAAKPAVDASKEKSADSPTKLKTVVVTAQPEGSYKVDNESSPLYTEPLRDTPQTITIIPQALIQDQNATTLRDILRNVPGISFQAGEASSTVAGDNLSIRGFNARDDMFIDGIRDTGIYSRDAFNIENVEVVKGPASAYEGYGETGGSVNLVSKAPSLTAYYDITGGVGTNAYDRESLDINQPITEFGDTGMALRVNAFHQYNEVANRDFVYDGRWGFAPSLAIGLGTPTRITLSYLHQREDDLPDYGFPFINANAVTSGTFPRSTINNLAPLPSSNWYGLVNRDHETAVTDIPTLKIEHDFDNDIKVVNTTRYDRTSFYAYNVSARFDDGSPAALNMITRELSARDDVDTLIDNKTFVTVPFKTWGIPHTLVTSLELSRETDQFRTGSAPTGPAVETPLYNPNAYAAYPNALTYTDRNKNELEDIAYSLFDTIKFTPQWELTGGMRYDNLDASYVDPGPLTPSHFAREDNLASWRLALVYKPLPYASIYAGYGTSYNPSIQGTSDGASNDALAGNTATLPPEEDISYEIGTKWDLLNEKLSLNGALFRTDKTNARFIDPTSPGSVYALSGKQRVQGVELDVAGSITDQWKVFGGYVYMQSESLAGPASASVGDTLPNTPNQSASMWTTYDLPWNLTIGTGANFVDRRYALVNDLNSVPGYWTQQAMVAYKVTKNIDVQLNVYNIWDKNFIDLVGAHQAVPGAGRTVVFTTSFKF